MDDRELLKEYARSGSESAFAEFVHRRVDLVHSAALRQVGGDVHRAREVSQAVFLLVAREAAALSRHEAISGWLYTTTYRVAQRALRSERRRRHHENRAVSEAGLELQGRAVDWDALRPVLDEAMHELRAHERTVILLRFFEQRSTLEIGATLGLSESGARKGVDRALGRLRKILGRRGIVSTPAALAFTLASEAVSAAPPGLGGELSAGVLVGAAAPSTLLPLMSLTSLKVAVTVAAAFALGAWWLQVRELDASRGRLAAIAADQSWIDGAITAEKHRAAAARSAIDQAAGIASPVQLAESLPDSPGVTLASARAGLDADYSPLFRRFAFRGTELERFKDLLAERGVRSWTARRYVVVSTGRWMDEWANKTEELDYIAAGTRDIDDRIQALLGEEKYASFAAYERTRPWREPFLNLAQILRPIDPLTDEQVDQLAAWAAEAAPNFFTSTTKGDPKIPDAVLERARSILSSRQHNQLEQLQAASIARREIAQFSEAAASR